MRPSVRHTFARTAVIALLAGSCVLGPSTVMSQVPVVQVYLDVTLTRTDAVCITAGLPIRLYVAATGFNMWINAIEYRVELPPSLAYVGEIPTAPISVGSSWSGIASAWTVPQNGFDPLIVNEIIAVWQCTECIPDGVSDHVLAVHPHPVSGLIRATRWPDLKLFNAFGLVSIICPTNLPTEETTWGKVKSLYR